MEQQPPIEYWDSKTIYNRATGTYRVEPPPPDGWIDTDVLIVNFKLSNVEYNTFIMENRIPALYAAGRKMVSLESVAPLIEKAQSRMEKAKTVKPPRVVMRRLVYIREVEEVTGIGRYHIERMRGEGILPDMFTPDRLRDKYDYLLWLQERYGEDHKVYRYMSIGKEQDRSPRHLTVKDVLNILNHLSAIISERQNGKHDIP
jgi:hypothetical protein